MDNDEDEEIKKKLDDAGFKSKPVQMCLPDIEVPPSMTGYLGYGRRKDD